MTDFDKKLIEKVRKFSIWDYHRIDAIAPLADTSEGRSQLRNIQFDLKTLADETV